MTDPVIPILFTVIVPPPVQISFTANPVGGGVWVVTTTASRLVLSQPLTVWLAKYVAPFVNSVDEAKGVPPDVTSYHCRFDPVAVRLATVPAQVFWDPAPAGAEGIALSVTVTGSRATLSQLVVY
jgi:hypothetical protein